jgi:hypothetical protein
VPRGGDLSHRDDSWPGQSQEQFLHLDPGGWLVERASSPLYHGVATVQAQGRAEGMDSNRSFLSFCRAQKKVDLCRRQVRGSGRSGRIF